MARTLDALRRIAEQHLITDGFEPQTLYIGADMFDRAVNEFNDLRKFVHGPRSNSPVVRLSVSGIEFRPIRDSLPMTPDTPLAERGFGV